MGSIFESFLSSPEMLETFSESRFLAAMLRFSASLARNQARLGLIPARAAQSIIDTCKVELFDVAKIVRESGRAGSVSVPLVKSLKDTVGLFNKEAVPFVHFGSSSQDVIDTALALVTRDALRLIEADVNKTIAALLSLATCHAADPVLARTLMQPASVTSFGLKCAGWAAPLVRSLERLRRASGNALSVQLGGVVGTLAEMNGLGSQVRELMADDLQLKASLFSWHTQRDEWVALGCELGLLVGSLGKTARDISLMSQYEVGEVAEPLEAGRGGSSAMPHKQNPVGCMVALAASVRVPQRVAALLATLPQEHERALGNWQAELAEWPGLLMSAHGAARAMARTLPGLQVNPLRMRANLEAVRLALPAEAAEEWFRPGLAVQAADLTHAQVKALKALHLAAQDSGTIGVKNS